MSEAIVDHYEGGFNQTQADRDRTYDAAVMRKGFKKLFGTVEAIQGTKQSHYDPIDILRQAAEAALPVEIRKVEQE